VPLDFVGRSRPLTSNGFSIAAQSLSVKAPEVWALLEVETSSCGFLPDRRPQILFERHIFHRLTGGIFDDGDVSDAMPGEYGSGGAHQYERLGRAVEKDRGAALKSTSWGLGQILGEHFAASGFTDIDKMVTAMSDSEDAQLAAVVSFLKTRRLDLILHAHDWTSFASHYNGSSYAQNRYDLRLRGEFQKYSFGAMPDFDVRAAQLYLTFMGFDPGQVDGIMGSRTRAALRSFQTSHGLAPTVELDDEILAFLAHGALD
jgi:hypothetical protein